MPAVRCWSSGPARLRAPRRCAGRCICASCSRHGPAPAPETGPRRGDRRAARRRTAKWPSRDRRRIGAGTTHRGTKSKDMSQISSSARRRRRILAAGVVAILFVAVVVAITSSGSSPGPTASTVLTVQRTELGLAIPSGFVGLSLEYPALEVYAGSDPQALDPVVVSLLRYLAPGQRRVLRIGGDSTDWAWWPLAGVTRPPGIRYDLTPRLLAVMRALSAALDARLVLGINLEADSSAVASGEARALIAGVGRQSIEALELGNEPELYGSFNWYRQPAGGGVKGRPRSYDPTQSARDAASRARAPHSARPRSISPPCRPARRRTAWASEWSARAGSASPSTASTLRASWTRSARSRRACFCRPTTALFPGAPPAGRGT